MKKSLNIRKKIRSLNNLVMPPAEIGGLQVSNTSIRFMELKKGRNGELTSKSASLRLPPGIIADGRVKDRPNFVEALRSLHAQITPKAKETINVVLTVPAGDVYVETFNLPALEDKSIEEAADLNMQMISPNPIEKSYYSWMVVSNPASGENKIEVLGAFTLRDAIDEMISSLEEAGFAVAAIEFSSLSLKRLLVELGAVTSEVPYLLIKLTQEGLVFMIIKNGNLYFNYFYPWGKMAEESGEITIQNALSVIGSESQRVVNFHSSHFGGSISNIILITSIFNDEITAFLKTKYPSSAVTVIRSDQDNLHGVRGAALRGIIPRQEDTEIDLLSHDKTNAFWRDRIIRFVELWRNIAITAAVFLLVVFALDWYLITRHADSIKAANAIDVGPVDRTELINLQKEANNFNALVSALGSVKGANISLTSVIDKITAAAKPDISINRLSLRSGDLSGVLNASAPSREQIVTFYKERLAAIPEIAGIDLPFSNVNSQPDGTFVFVVNFKLVPSNR